MKTTKLLNISVGSLLVVSLSMNVVNGLEKRFEKSYQNYLDSFIHKERIIETIPEDPVYEGMFSTLDLPEKEIKEETIEDNGMSYIGNFKLTGYDDCSICQEEWVGTTALGVSPSINNTIAVDPSIIPLGSYVYIEGLGTYHAEDVGGGVKGNHIDIFVGSHEETYSVWCNCYADVYVITK